MESSGSSSAMAQTPRTVLKVGDLLNSKEDMRLMDSSKHVADHEPAKIATTNPNPGMEINSNAAASTHHHGLYGSAQPQVLNRNEAVVDPNTNQQKGLTRYASSPRLEYLHHGVWKPAIYHTELREMILRIFDHFGRYDEEPSKGLDPWDRTSLHKRQQSWVFRDREKRPEVLFLWEPSDQPPDYVPGLWHHENKMVLDTDDRPIQLWKELPMTISGQCEGWRMEAWIRTNPRITMNDIKARMPRDTSKGLGLVRKPINIAALASRRARDRSIMGLKAWIPREGSLLKEFRMLQMIPEHTQREIVRTNSTRCHQDLTVIEIEYIEEGNKGTAASLAKAGPRRLDDATRQKNLDKKEQARASKGLDLSTIRTYGVVKEAMRKPAIGRVRRAQYSASDVITGQNTLGATRVNHVEKHGNGVLLAANYDGQGTRRGPYLLEGPNKKPRHSAAGEGNRALGNITRSRLPISDTDQRHANNENVLFLEKVSQNPAGPDFKFKKPTTPLERLSIIEALDISRADFQRYLGHPPPFITTGREESYAYQLSELQSLFERCYPGGRVAPTLEHWHHKWEGSIDDGWRNLPVGAAAKGIQGGSGLGDGRGKKRGFLGSE